MKTELVIIDPAEFRELVRKVNLIAEKIQKLTDAPKEKKVLHSSAEVCLILKISSRTLQSYRDQGMISFVQAGRKTLYSDSNLEEFTNRYGVKKFAK